MPADATGAFFDPRSPTLRRTDWVELTEKVWPHLFPICRVRVLMVTDGALDFSGGGTGMSPVINALAAAPLGPHLWPQVTTGHRLGSVSDASAGIGHPHVARGIKGFRFDDASHFGPGMYDQVWLFGHATANGAGDSPAGWSGTLAEAELRALAGFMSGTGAFAGREPGGVFATGDHGGIGSALCGFVPRVRTMRRWYATTGPFGNPGAPGMSDTQRNDTNRNPADPSLPTMVDTQSDAVPQTIAPRWYHRPHWVAWKSIRFPHPLLCGRAGAITVLPDHPHEGECRLPYETDRTLSFGGAAFEEWPAPLAGPAGSRVMPEVVAESTVVAGARTPGKDPAAAQHFGAICAYDGDRAGVGRVVTDATWHHFVTMNVDSLPGYPDATELPASDYGRVTDYWRNIAKWLAPPSKRACVRRNAWWYAAWNDLLVESVGDGRMLSPAKSPLKAIHELGAVSRAVITKLFGPCDEVVWTLVLPEKFFPVELVREFDPWPPVVGPRPLPQPDPVPWLDPEPLLDIALGGAMAALREAFPERDPRVREKAEAAMDDIMLEGARAALARAAPGLEAAAKRAAEVGRALQSGGARR